MQNTRLNTLLDRVFQQFTRWAQNPWRRISVIIISLLLGNFLASAISTSTGQKAELDISISLMLLLITESISWLTYGSDLGRRRSGEIQSIANQRPIWIGIINSLKLGLVYGLFMEALKLGS